jgi:hypothetical protein
MELTKATRFYQPIDKLVLVPHEQHNLWLTRKFLHCTSPATWQEYSEAINQWLIEDCYHDHTGTVQLWYGCEQWQVFKDAVDKLYCHLRNEDIPVNDATISGLVLQVYDKHSALPYLRGRAALCIYLRIDHEPKNLCHIQLESGEQTQLPPGAMVILSGYRRHRIEGCGHILSFQLNVPALSRNETLQGIDFRRDNISDEIVFAAATAQPLTNPLASAVKIQEKLNWLANRQNRSYRNNDCIAVRRFLIDNVDPSLATSNELAQVRRHGSNYGAHIDNQVVTIESVPMLTPDQCAILRGHLCDHITSVVPDSVDDLPEYQVNLSNEQITKLLDEQTATKLFNLPDLLHQHATLKPDLSKCSVSVFLRLYSPNTRPYIAFHSDNCRYTAVVALNDQSEYQGGQFVMLGDKQLKYVPWHTGKATLHAGNLIHGISRILKGTRYSLVLFYHVKEDQMD